MLERIHQTIGSSIVSWPAIAGTALLVGGFALQTVGMSVTAGFMGLFGIVLLLFATVSYGSLALLKLTAPLFMDYEA